MQWFRDWWQKRSTFANPTEQLIRLLAAGQSTSSGRYLNSEIAMAHVPVYACVRILAESISSLPLNLYRRLPDGSRQKATDNPLYRVLHSAPNHEQTSLEFLEMMVGHVVLKGNAYAQILRDGGGRITELIPLHPDRVKITRDKSAAQHLIYTYSPREGPPIPYGREKIWHVRGLSSDGVYGVNPIQLTREAISISIAQEEFSSALFKNAARPSGVLEHPAKLSKQAKDALEASWQDKYAGSTKAGLVPVLEEGMKWHQLSMSNEDAQFLQLRKYQLAEIARIFRIPLHMLAELDKATFSNIEQQSMEFVRDTLRPWLVRIEQSIWRDLFLPMEQEILFAEFNVNGLLRGDAASRFASYAIARQNGWMNANEIREFENMNPIDGPEGSLYVANSALFPIGQQVQQQKTPLTPARELLPKMIEAILPRIQKREENGLAAHLKRGGAPEAFYSEHRLYAERAFNEILEPLGFNCAAKSAETYILAAQARNGDRMSKYGANSDGVISDV